MPPGPRQDIAAARRLGPAALAAPPDRDGTGRLKTRDDRIGPGAVRARSAYGAELVELVTTRNGWSRVDWHGRRRWLGGDPETARQTYQRYCLHAFLLDRTRRLLAWTGRRR